MKLINRKRTSGTPLKDAAATRIATFIVRLQLAMVKALKQIERRCTLRQKKMLFFFFCALNAASLIYILSGTVSGDSKSSPAITISGQVPPVMPPIPPVTKDSLTRSQRKY